MIVRLYSVYDSVAEEYGPIFQAKNDKVALRNVIQMFTEMKVNIANFYSFHLYHVGDFDTALGDFASVHHNEDEISIDHYVLDGVFDAYKVYCDGLKKESKKESKEDK